MNQTPIMINRTINKRYKILSLRARGSMGEVYRAIDLESGEVVAIKKLFAEFTSDNIDDIIRFKAEAWAASRFHHSCIVTVRDILETEDGIFVVMEYCDGRSLEEILSSPDAAESSIKPFAIDASRNILPLHSSIAIMLQLCEALSHIHDAGIIHRDLKPSNIIILNDASPDCIASGHGTVDRVPKIKIIDFGLALVRDYSGFNKYASDKNVRSKHDDPSIMGTFAYMPPELFRPDDRPSIDERGDLYSLGIIWYRLVTGVLPFTGEDIHSMIHQHLAQIPRPAIQLHPELPAILDKMILKLIEKDPTRRYQSARGLLNDLHKYLGGIQNFIPGLQNTVCRLNDTTKFIGREREILRLKASLEKALAGKGVVCLVSGPSGIGKTMFAEEIKRHMFALNKGLFIQGTCMPQTENIAYWPFSSALDIFIKKFNNYPFDRRREIEHAIQQALGCLGEIIIKINPMMNGIIKDCPALIPLAPERENNRFLTTVVNFFYNLGKIANGLVLFLDDLQWMDKGSATLLLELAKGISHHPLLIIGAYRDDEISPSHDINHIIRLALKNRYNLTRVILAPFDATAMGRFIADTINLAEGSATVSELARFILNRFGGNPFFAKEILRYLVDKNAVMYDHTNQLVINATMLARVDIPQSLVDFLLKRIALLDDDTRDVLSHGAVIGKRFDISVLFELCRDAIFKNISTAERDSYITGIIDRSIKLNLAAIDLEDNYKVTFTHDAIREAFYRNLDDERKSRLHLRMVEALEKKYGKDIQDNTGTHATVFELAYHSIQAEDLDRSVRYAYPAALAARARGANEDALFYLTHINRAIESTGMARDSLWIDVNKNIGEIYLIIGRYEDSAQLFLGLLEHSQNTIEAAYIYKQICESYYKMGNAKLCEHYGRIGLRVLGAGLPRNRVLLLLGLAKEFLVHQFYNWVPLSAPKKKQGKGSERYMLLAGFYHSLGRMYAYTDNIKMAWVLLKGLTMAQSKMGISRELGMFLALYGALLMAVALFKGSLRYHDRALAMRREIDDQWGMAQSFQLIGTCYYFKRDPNKALEYIEKSIALYKRIGDIKEIGMSLLVKIWILFGFSDYENLRIFIEQYRDISQKIRDTVGLCFAYIFRGQMYIDIGDYNEAREDLLKAFAIAEEGSMWLPLSMTHIRLARIYLFHANPVKAIAHLEAAKKLDDENNFLRESVVDLYAFLADAYIADYKTKEQECDSVERKAAQKKIQRACTLALKKTKASHIHHGVAMRIMAKFYALINNNRRAEELFIRTMNYARTYGAQYEEAAAMYEYGLFLYDTDRPMEAKTQMETAYSIFLARGWGGYVQIIRELLDIKDETSNQSLIVLLKRIGQEKINSSVMELISHINSDIPFAELTRRALDMCIEITGASRGILLLNNKFGELEIAAQSMNSEDDGRGISQTIVNRVIQNGEAILTSSADGDSMYSSSDSIVFHDLRSILGVPIKSNEKIIGVCYLDNPLSGDVFNNDQVEFLSIIMKQIALSYEMSHLRGKTESLVAVDVSDELCKKYNITSREREVIALMARGYSYKEIAAELSISSKTIEFHKMNIYRKMGIHKKSEMMDMVMKHT